MPITNEYTDVTKELKAQGLEHYVRKMETFINKTAKEQSNRRVGNIIRGHLELFFATAFKKSLAGESIETNGGAEEMALSLVEEIVEATKTNKRSSRGAGRITQDGNEAMKLLEEIIKRDEAVLTLGSDRGVWIVSLNNRQGKQVIVQADTQAGVLADAVGKWVREEYVEVKETN